MLKLLSLLSRGAIAVVFVSVLMCGYASAQAEGAYSIVIDNTGSMRLQLDTVQMLGKKSAARLSERGPVTIFSLETDNSMPKTHRAKPAAGTPWTSDKNLLRRAIDAIYIQPGLTVIYDAITAAADAVKEKAAADNLSEKAVIVISDGEDRASRTKRDDLIQRLKDDGVKVFVIGLTVDLDPNSGFFVKSTKGKSTDFLKKITKETGGNAVFPNPRKDTDIDKLLTELFAK